MLKKFTAFMMVCVVVLLSSGCSMLTKDKVVNKNEVKDFKVVVFTEDKKKDSKRYDAIEALSKEFKEKYEEEKEKGSKAPKKEIIHEIIPSDFEKDPNKVEQKIKKLAKDKKVQAFVVSTDKKGLLNALKEVKKVRQEIITISAPMGEDPSELSEYVDVNLSQSEKFRAESLVALSKKLGSTTFIHYSTQNDLSNQKILERKEQIKIACKNSQVGFIEIGLPNYSNDKEKETMKNVLEQNIESQVKKFGKNINIYGTNEDLDAIILNKAKDLKYIMAGQSNPDPTKTYPEAINLKIDKADKENYEIINDRISEWARKNGLSGRLGGYAMPYDVFLIRYATELSAEMVLQDLTQEDVCDKDYLELFAENKFGYGTYFEAYSEETYNYQYAGLYPQMY